MQPSKPDYCQLRCETNLKHLSVKAVDAMFT